MGDRHAVEPLLDESDQDRKNSSGVECKYKGKCVACYHVYRVLVIVLLAAILGLVTDMWIHYKKDEGSKSCNDNQAVYNNPVLSLLNQKLPEACGHLSAIPSLEDDSYELRQVQVIIRFSRHGDRVQWQPKKCWSTNTAVWNCSISVSSTPSFNRTATTMNAFRLYRHKFEYGIEPFVGNCYVGQLTLKGYQQQIQNGMYLKQAYINSGFLGASFNSSDVYIRSDDVPRTLQSAEAVIYGMYPPPTLQGKQVELIDIHTRDINAEIMESNPTLCPIVNVYKSEAVKSSKFVAHGQNITDPLLRQLSLVLGKNLTVDDIDPLSDCMVVYTCHDKPLPVGITPALLQRTLDELVWNAKYLYSYPSVQNGSKANIGFLIESLFERMEGRVEGKDQTKFLLYSGHDTTLLPLLLSFQLNDVSWPPYASLMAIELYKSKQSGKHAVRVIYNGQALQLPFCSGSSNSSSISCEWEDFKEHLQSLIPESGFCDGQ